MALVSVIMGSASDSECMRECTKVLEELNIDYEVKIISAHRTPELLYEFAKNAEKRGVEVLVAGAGWAAHLAGALAANTTLPVIGVPIDSSPLKGIDALLSTVQMPPGIPVATMAIGPGGARNAGIFAAQVLALKYGDIRDRIRALRERVNKDALAKSGL